MKTLRFVIVLSLCFYFICTSAKIMDTKKSLLSRKKRFLIFQEGINWIQMIAGIGFPVQLRDESVTWGATVKSYYLLPTNASDFLRPSITVARKKRSMNRWEIYSALGNFAQSFGLGDGKACVLRSICEIALSPLDRHSGLLAEILHAIFTPSETKEEKSAYSDHQYDAAEVLGKTEGNCQILFPECKVHLLDQISKFIA